MIAQPPQPPPALKVGRRSHLRFVLGALVGALLGVIVLGALGFFIVDDLGQRNQVTSVRGSLASAQAGASSQAAADQDEIAALQSQEAADQQQITALQSQVPTTPDFVLAAQGWNGSCTSDSCFPDATFINRGQAGEAVAVFQLFAGSATSGSVLASCSAAIPFTPANGTADATCTASSANLAQYWLDNPSGQVDAVAKVTNP